MASESALRSLLKHAKDTVDECLPGDQPLNSDGMDGKLNEVLFAVSAAGHGNTKIELSGEDKATVWLIVCKLWNWCADIQISASETPRWMVAIRQHTSDLLEIVKDDELSTDERSTKLAIYHKTGAAHAAAGEHEAAEAAFSRAQEQCMRLMKDLQGTDVTEAQQCDIITGCMDLIIDRLVNAWKLHQKALASDLLSQATELVKQSGLPCHQRFHMCRQVILACLERGQECLSAQEKDAQSLLDHAYQLITEHLELDEDDADFEKFRKEATYLHAQALRLLSQAYLLNGQAAPAHACVQNVRKLQDPLAGSPGLCLTAIQALVQLEQPEQADAELLALVGHKDVSAALCLAGLSAVLKLPGCCALKPAADIILERFATDATSCVCTLPLRMVELLLGDPEEEKLSKDREALVLDITSNKKLLRLFRKADTSAREHSRSMYVLLWNHGTNYFMSKDYNECVGFYAAAQEYAEASAKATIARQLALAHLAQQELDRALEDLDIAAEHDPSSVYTTFVKIKVLLTQGEASKALDELQPLMACEDFSLDFLRVVCAEATLASCLPVAKQAMKLLWEDTIATQGPSEKPGVDAVIARNLFKLIADMEVGYDLERARCKPSAAAEGNGSNSQDSVHQELAGLFSQAQDRLEAVGKDSFFGAESPAWLAAASYNVAFAAVLAKDLTAATVLFRTSGSYHEAYLTATAQEVPFAHIPAAKTALSAALQCMRSQKDTPSMDMLAETVRQLYELSSEDEVLALLADISVYLRTLGSPAYPRREMSWLVSTTWNRGCKHAKFLRHAQALPFMTAALGLMDLCEDFKDRREDLAKAYKEMKDEAPIAGTEASSNDPAMPSGLAFGIVQC